MPTHCTGIRSVSITDSVMNIGYNAFEGVQGFY